MIWVEKCNAGSMQDPPEPDVCAEPVFANVNMRSPTTTAVLMHWLCFNHWRDLLMALAVAEAVESMADLGMKVVGVEIKRVGRSPMQQDAGKN